MTTNKGKAIRMEDGRQSSHNSALLVLRSSNTILTLKQGFGIFTCFHYAEILWCSPRNPSSLEGYNLEMDGSFEEEMENADEEDEDVDPDTSMSLDKTQDRHHKGTLDRRVSIVQDGSYKKGRIEGEGSNAKQP